MLYNYTKRIIITCVSLSFTELKWVQYCLNNFHIIIYGSLSCIAYAVGLNVPFRSRVNKLTRRGLRIMHDLNIYNFDKLN